VLFETAHIVGGLEALARACAGAGAEIVIDAYHALGAVPFALHEQGLGSAWVLGGGYKYLQLGEGNCFLRLPAHAEQLRPAVTGWYAEFGALAAEHDPSRVAYGRGAERFAGATYDPTSHYRAARVFAFFQEQGLTPERLRASYRRQIDLLAAGFDALGIDDAIVTRDRALDLDRVGGFLALRSPRASELQRALSERGVLTDSRGPWLRLGPAPYLSDEQLETAIARLGEAVTELR
jgi:kynureninase